MNSDRQEKVQLGTLMEDIQTVSLFIHAILFGSL
jgi:hypothetical protein